MCMGALPVNMSVYHMCLPEVRRGYQSPWNWKMMVCCHVAAEGPLEEGPVLINTEPSLQLPT